MSLQRFNNNNIINNHSKKLIEFQKNLEDIQKFDNKLENKIKNLINNFNETIDSINHMFINKQFEVKTTIQHNFNKYILPRNPHSSSNFGQSITQISDNIVIVSDPLARNTGCVYFYQKNQYNSYKEIQEIKPSNITKYFGQSISINNNILAITGINKGENNCGHVYIYYKNNHNNWEKYQLIEVQEENIQNSCIKVLNNIIMATFNKKFVIIEKNEDRAWEKIQNINNVSQFSIHDKTLSMIINNEIVIYEKNPEWNETQKISFKNIINNLYIYNDKLLINHNNSTELYEKDKLENWGKRQTFDIISYDFAINQDTIIIAGILGEMNPLIAFGDEIYNGVLYIYKKYNHEWQLLRKMSMANMKTHLKLKLDLYENNIVFSNYYHDSSHKGEIYVVKESLSNLKWKGAFSSYMNKIELQITGDFASDNPTPYIRLNWPDLRLPKIRNNFYYKNIPNISINIYDLDNDSYRNDLKVTDIMFGNNGLNFYVKNIDKIPYSYIFYISINYLIN